MDTPRSGPHSANLSANLSAKRSKPPKRRKPGPKPGPRAKLTRTQRRLLKAEKDAFLAKFERFLECLEKGDTHAKAMTKCKLVWRDISTRLHGDTGLQARYQAAVNLREDFWKIERTDSMHARAVHGVKEPMVSAGRRVTEKIVYANDLLLSLVEADDPQRFAKRTKSEVAFTHSEAMAKLLDELERDTPVGSTSPVTPHPGLPLPPKPPPPPVAP